MLLTAVVGVTLERVAYRPLRRKGVNRLYVVITALMCGLILENGNLALLGASRKSFPTLIATKVYNVDGVIFTNLKLAVIGVAILSFLLLQIVVNRTKIGMIKKTNEEYRPLSIKINARHALNIRRNIIVATAKAFQPHLFIVDKAPMDPVAVAPDTEYLPTALQHLLATPSRRLAVVDAKGMAIGVLAPAHARRRRPGRSGRRCGRYRRGAIPGSDSGRSLSLGGGQYGCFFGPVGRVGRACVLLFFGVDCGFLIRGSTMKTSRGRLWTRVR